MVYLRLDIQPRRCNSKSEDFRIDYGSTYNGGVHEKDLVRLALPLCTTRRHPATALLRC